MVLELQRAFVREGMVLAAALVSAAALQRRGILQDHAVEQHGEAPAVEHFAVLENGAAENNVVNLPLAGRAAGVDDGRVVPIQRRSLAVGIVGIL